MCYNINKMTNYQIFFIPAIVVGSACVVMGILIILNKYFTFNWYSGSGALFKTNELSGCSAILYGILLIILGVGLIIIGFLIRHWFISGKF
jgi:hypothetical protein